MPRIDAENLELEEKVIQLKPVAKTVKGGRKRRFSALVVVGDGKGHVGAAIGKAVAVPDAIRKGAQKAKTRMTRVALNGGTIPFTVVGRVGAARVLLKPASPGTGVIAGGPVRAVVEAAGIRDVLTKCLGSDNATNCVWAALDGLKQLRDPAAVAAIRGVSVDRFPKYLQRLRSVEEGEGLDERLDLRRTDIEGHLTEKPHRVLEGPEGNGKGVGPDADKPDGDTPK